MTKSEQFLFALGDVADTDILAAAPTEQKQKKIRFTRWAATLAACLALVLIAIPVLQRLTKPDDHAQSVISLGGITRMYKSYSTTEDSAAIVWPWELKTIEEQYTNFSFDGTTYRTTARPITAARCGERLGDGTASGYDMYTETTKTETFSVYAINGIAPTRRVAVDLDGTRYVFTAGEHAEIPATLGDLLDNYVLAADIHLTEFTTGKKSYRLADDAPLYALLAAARTAPLRTDMDFSHTAEVVLSFSVTSEALGVYRRALTITSDGFLRTNLLDYGYTFEIGTDTAGAILEYVTANATETASIPYAKRLVGTIVAIEEHFLVLDDSVLCADASDGLQYRIPTDDLRISRYLTIPHFEIGDTVAVSFAGTIDTDTHTVSDAYAISKVHLFLEANTTDTENQNAHATVTMTSAAQQN